MTGPEHYRAAERLLSEASFVRAPDDPRPVDRLHPAAHAALIARAQVHATLADAATKALPVILPLVGDDQQVTDWARALGITTDTAQVNRSQITDALALLDTWEHIGVVGTDDAHAMRQALGEGS